MSHETLMTILSTAAPFVRGAGIGFVVAAGHDVWTWSQSEDPFIWTKAIKRWVGGAIVGSGLLGAVAH